MKGYSVCVPSTTVYIKCKNEKLHIEVDEWVKLYEVKFLKSNP